MCMDNWITSAMLFGFRSYCVMEGSSRPGDWLLIRRRGTTKQEGCKLSFTPIER